MAYLVRLTALVLLLASAAIPASAACLVEYKAKQDNPLRLDYGFRVLPDSVCDEDMAWDILSEELAQEGWTLLSVISVQGTNRWRRDRTPRNH